MRLAARPFDSTGIKERHGNRRGGDKRKGNYNDR
jgi:hypothetical protein